MSPSAGSSSKRSRPTSTSAPAAAAEKPVKRIKPSRFHVASDSLKWKPVKTAPVAGFDEGGGMMMLEELDDVDVEWEEGMNGQKVAKFIEREATGAAPALAEVDEKSSNKTKKGKGKIKVAEPEEEEDDTEEEATGLPTFAGVQTEDLDDEDESDNEGFDDAKLPAWKSLELHTALKRAILALEFNKPTDIQAQSLPSALQGKDIVGVAETGSGKTLAYSLPILSYLLDRPALPASRKRPLSALILCPTRELAIQVVDHLNKVVAHAAPPPKAKGKGKSSGPPRISIGSVVGGLSAQKQKRIVERGCDILVATPGRLWDLIKSDDELAAGVRGMRFLVIDEADRMIETGHFAELENIVTLTERQVQSVGPDEDDPIFANASNLLTETEARDDMQTFVFSATLSKDLQHNLKRRQRTSGKKGGKKASALEDLVERLDFRDKEPEVIDLAPEGGVVKALKESMIDCVVSEKDLYLYYFLLRYPGRSLVFVGSIDGIRRLQPLFEVLQMPVYPLHSQLQQKQRLKNLDRFKSAPNGVLIATDVAARGLDIPQVEHVIHFNLPRTADAYIHRSGRTARAQKPGFALLLCSAEEKGIQRSLMNSLKRTTDIPELPIESGFLPKLKERIRLAKEIEKAQHLVKKENHDRNWLQETADAMGIDIDPSMLSDPEDPDLPYQRDRKTRPGKTVNPEALKAELKSRLREPLMARGVSAKYPTSGSKIIIDDLLSSAGHGTLLGASTSKAYEEAALAKKRALKRKGPKQGKSKDSSGKA